MTDTKLVEALIILSVNIGANTDTIGDEDLQVEILENLASSVQDFSKNTREELRRVATLMVLDSKTLDPHKEFINEFWLSENGCLSD